MEAEPTDNTATYTFWDLKRFNYWIREILKPLKDFKQVKQFSVLLQELKYWLLKD